LLDALQVFVRSNAEGAFLITIRQADSDEHVPGRYQPPFDAFQFSTVFAGGECRSEDGCQKVVGHVRICCTQKHFFFSERYRRSSMLRSVATVYLQVFFVGLTAVAHDDARCGIRTLCGQTESTLSPSRSTCSNLDTIKVVLVQSLDEDLAARNLLFAPGENELEV
jgi:hypothetical protein